MRTTLALAVLLIACLIAHSQAVPSASSGAAYLRYSGYYSESGQFGGTLGNWHMITPSASLGYSNGKKQFPMSVQYAGGYTWTLSGPDYTTGLFQRLLISQGIEHGRWTLTGSDDVSYRPQTPVTGFSGIPGTGEPIGGAVPPSAQTILALNTHALENIAHGDFEQLLNYRSSLHIEATHDIMYFPDGNGLDNNSGSASAGLDFRLNARNSLTAHYTFSDFGYSGYDFRITTNMPSLGFNRSWTRALTTTAMAGPEWVASSSSSLPKSVGVGAKAALNYQRRQTVLTLNYLRLTSAGSGYMIGSQSETVSANLSRHLNRPFAIGMTVGYNRNDQLFQDWKVSGIYGGTQASWRIGRNLNAFVNYTAMSQNSGTHAPATVVNEFIQTISCGIGFSKETKPPR